MTRARDVADSALVHLHTEDFSAASTVSVNNVFSADYEFYLIRMNVLCSINSQTIFSRWRANGSDQTGTNYYGGRINVPTTGVEYGGGTSAQNAYPLTAVATSYSFITCHISNTQNQPRLTHEAWSGEISAFTSGAGGYKSNYIADGFTIYPASGTITGKMSVYGYRD